MATRSYKLNKTRVTKDNIKYKLKSPTESTIVSNTTNTRSFTSAVTYNAYKTVDEAANKLRGKLNSFISDLLDTDIEEFCGFNNKNERYLRRLMMLNVSEHEITMNALGTDAAFNGNGSNYTNLAQSPSYAEDINYTDNFAKQIDGIEKKGLISTRNVISDNSGNYVNHNQLYSKNTNLYYLEGFDYDDNKNYTLSDVAIDTDSNQNSILYKTKTLFSAKKINTLISRFSSGINGEDNANGLGDAKSKYGKSHGRNLLTHDAEYEGKNGYKINGYNNPYCRVWTHHYQYNELFKRIRPFYILNDDGSYKSEKDLKDFHIWKHFGNSNEWGWKFKENSNWEKSVLKNNGMVNITPKYDGGGEKNLHTKDCMFSIENLAWKGYNPYSFEKALSWEQRGPNGGRIMWFPPYGIEFNETTNVNWVEHQFIGRGENIYTYANTSRTGTLSFLLIVDHPSVIDYASWHNSGEITDSDLLRFFAGCDSDSKHGVLSNIRPTPLTDEYITKNTVGEKSDKVSTKTITSEEKQNEETFEINSYVFFPNNYSGYYDHVGQKVEAIAYLIAGDCAQKEISDNNIKEDVELNFESLTNRNNFKFGYESLEASEGISTSSNNHRNYILGVKFNNSNYEFNDKKWYYRIDGKYEMSKNNDKIMNKYNQILALDTNYEDNTNFKLNNNTEQIKNIFNNTQASTDDDNLYSFIELISALLLEKLDNSQEDEGNKVLKIYENIREFCKLDEDRVNKLKQKFIDNNLIKISIIGHSNSHDNSIYSQKRNFSLAKQRAETVKDFLTKYFNFNSEIIETDIDDNVSVESKSVNDLRAKAYRSAKITFTFSRTVTTEVTNSNNNETNELFYKVANTDENRSKFNQNNWTEIDETTYEKEKEDFLTKKETNKNGVVKYFVNKSYVIRNNNTETNNVVRYDQEYYFFKKIENENPIVWDSLMKKIQYFDPAFHSQSPESFNARLTFLQQCTRQGNTVGASDEKSMSANNLAFGQAPYCVLRLGDFYNQMICIDNVQINYEPLQWDLNTEGIGVQPLLARVNLSFKFIGGGDLAGPVRRLQNAMTFNYYANTSLYDNRADRPSYSTDYKTGISTLNANSSYAYTAQMAKNKNNDNK